MMVMHFLNVNPKGEGDPGEAGMCHSGDAASPIGHAFRAFPRWHLPVH